MPRDICIRPGGVRESAVPPNEDSEEGDEAEVAGAGILRLLSILGLLLLLLLAFRREVGRRPPRFVTKYSQTMPRLAHRAHVGLSRLHLSFDTAHPWQLSRSLGATDDRRAEAGREPNVDMDAYYAPRRREKPEKRNNGGYLGWICIREANCLYM